MENYIISEELKEKEIGGDCLSQGLALERVECARNAGVFILLRILIGMLIFLALGTIFYIPVEGMLLAIQDIKANLLIFILTIAALILMSFFNLVIAFPLNNSLKQVNTELSWNAARLRMLDFLLFTSAMVLLILEIPIFYQVFLLSLVIYALHLILVGYLIFKSKYISRVLGLLLVVGAISGYLFQVLTGFFAQDLIWLSTIGGEITITIEIALALILIYTARTTTFDDDDSKSRVIKILSAMGEATTAEIVAEASKESGECKDRAPRTLRALESESLVMKRFSKEKKGYVWTLVKE
jgi:hypothetical protein